MMPEPIPPDMDDVLYGPIKQTPADSLSPEIAAALLECRRSAWAMIEIVAAGGKLKSRKQRYDQAVAALTAAIVRHYQHIPDIELAEIAKTKDTDE